MERKIVAPELVSLMDKVLDAAYDVHTDVGPGCLERVYETCLAKVLEERGHVIQRQRGIPFLYHGEVMPVAFRADLVVDDQLIVETKSIAQLLPIHQAQVRTYLRLSGIPLGLLLCFGAQHLRDGYDRIAHPEFVFLPPSQIRRAAGAAGAAGPREQPPQGSTSGG